MIAKAWRLGVAGAVLGALGLAAAALVLSRRPPAVPRVTAIRQVTHDGTRVNRGTFGRAPAG